MSVVVELEVHPVDGEVPVVSFGGLDEASPQLRPGGLGWVGEGPRDVIVGDDLFHHSAPFQDVIEAAFRNHIVIREVDQSQLGIAQSEPSLGAVLLDEMVFGHPITLSA